MLSSFWAGAQGQAPGTITAASTRAIDGALRGIALDADSRILIAGDFNHVSGAHRQHVARLNSDGSVDSSFVPGPELWLQPSNRVTQIAVQRNGSVLLGGHFDLVDSRTGTNTTVYVVRLTKAGSLDGSFGPVTSQPFRPLPPAFSKSGSQPAMALQSDDKLVIAYEGCDDPPTLPFPGDRSSTTVLRRVTGDGQPDVTFLEQNLASLPPLPTEPVQICVEPSGSCLVLSEIPSVVPPLIRRFDAQGILQFAFGVPGNETGMGPISAVVNAIGSAEDEAFGWPASMPSPGGSS